MKTFAPTLTAALVVAALLCLHASSATAAEAALAEGDSTACVCASDKHEFQLLRGSDQVARCEAGYYCNCAKRTVQRCRVWVRQWRFDETYGICNYWKFDCKSYDFRTAEETPATSTR